MESNKGNVQKARELLKKILKRQKEGASDKELRELREQYMQLLDYNE